VSTEELVRLGGEVVVGALFVVWVFLWWRLSPAMSPIAKGRKQRIVILGGGFAGVYTAQSLERALGRRDDFEIVLLSKENYFVFQPMLPEVISGSIGLLDTVSPIRHLLPRTDIHVREIESIDLEAKTVLTRPGFQPHPHVVAYDHLVLALGTVTDFRGLRGLAEHAFPFKNLADALRLRNHVIRALEEAAIEEHEPELQRQLLTFVVAGGGFSGVEVVAELNDFVRSVAKNYAGIDTRSIRVVLLHSGDRILPEMSEKLALFAQGLLRERGVEIRLKARLEAATADEALLAGGERIPTKTIVSTVPSSPHPLIEALEVAKTKNGRVRADRFLRVEGQESVWALGDCAQVPGPDGTPAPPTAQHAVRQAETLAANLVAAVRGGAPRPFTFKGLGKMGSLGHRSAVAEILGFKISGFFAWWLWRTIYLSKLPGWGRKLKVVTSWTLDLVLPPELVQLQLGAPMGIMKQHFEPGEDICREGELADKVFVLLEGSAEVRKTSPEGGADVVLAHLGPGQYFGEMGVVGGGRRTATVRCVEPLDALCLPRQEFSVLATHFPELKRSVERVSKERADANAERLARTSP
jgi:NADH dehydrogenase